MMSIDIFKLARVLEVLNRIKHEKLVAQLADAILEATKIEYSKKDNEVTIMVKRDDIVLAKIYIKLFL